MSTESAAAGPFDQFTGIPFGAALAKAGRWLTTDEREELARYAAERAGLPVDLALPKRRTP